MQKVLFPLTMLAVSVIALSKIKGQPRFKANYPDYLHFLRPRVLEGWFDINDDYPFVVAFINDKDQKACTASLITKQWVITAAHCLGPFIRYIRYGNMTLPWEETKFKSKVLKMISHPAYLKFSKFDIGLALVEEIVIKKFGRIHSACYKTFMGRAVRFAGFGSTYPSYKYSLIGEDKAREKDEKLPLQVGEGVIFNVESQSDYVISIAPKCTNTHHGPYFGDSGGPLFVDKKIVGVLSRGDSSHVNSKKFVNPKHPEINYYTAVSPYLDWLRATMNSKH